MDSQVIKFYTIPHHHCSCRDEYENLNNIGKVYRKYYEDVKNGISPSVSLNNLKMTKMCCRTKFLSMSYVPMIDRSINRFYDDRRDLLTKDTRKLEFKNKIPEFPLLGN